MEEKDESINRDITPTNKSITTSKGGITHKSVDSKKSGGSQSSNKTKSIKPEVVKPKP